MSSAGHAAREILRGVAVGLDATKENAPNPGTMAAAGAAAVIVKLVIRLLDERTPVEAIESLKAIAIGGSIVIRDDELDDQVKKVLAGLGAG